MCKPGFGHNTNFLKWMGWFPYISCNHLHVAGRLTVIYSNGLSSVYAMLTWTSHQLSQQCPRLIAYLRLCGSYVRKHTPTANARPSSPLPPPVPAAPTSVAARRKESQARWLTSNWKVRSSPFTMSHRQSRQEWSNKLGFFNHSTTDILDRVPFFVCGRGCPVQSSIL